MQLAMEPSISADDAGFVQAQTAVQALIDKAEILVPIGMNSFSLFCGFCRIP